MKRTKRFLALLLCMVMAITLVPVFGGTKVKAAEKFDSSVVVGDVVFPISLAWESNGDPSTLDDGLSMVNYKLDSKSSVLYEVGKFSKSKYPGDALKALYDELIEGFSESPIFSISDSKIYISDGVRIAKASGIIDNNNSKSAFVIYFKTLDDNVIITYALTVDDTVSSELDNIACRACIEAYVGLAITQQPVSTTVNEKELAYFEVKAAGSGLKYLWQYKEAGKSTWTDWTTKTTAKISVAYSSSRNGMSFRCIVTDSSGKKLTSNAATLTYAKPFSITQQPVSTTVNEKELAYFEVKAAGSGLKYLWQYKEAGKSTWTDWTTKTTAKISVAYAAFRDGMSFRCVVTDASGNKLTSNAATLTYKVNFAITQQPVSVTVNHKDLAYFEVKASGKGLKYLWQYKEAGKSTWTDWTSKTTAKISVAYAAYRNGMSFRCIVTDANGNKLTTQEISLKYKKPLAITSDPTDSTVWDWEYAYFGVQATGDKLKYLWQYKLNGSSEWVDWTTKTTDFIEVKPASYRDGMQVRCIVTDAYGKTATSNPATLQYMYNVIFLTIISNPVDTTVSSGQSASFSVEVYGEDVKYLWQYKLKGSSEWVDWKTKTTATIDVMYAEYRDGMQVQCIVTDKFGMTLTSTPATLYYE
ncbi:MAG: hypothetical protein K6E47_07345 [Lachnospiraceae bacterium]|nr:hypothetical protein [Lachnospiraceae bacterium]